MICKRLLTAVCLASVTFVLPAMAKPTPPQFRYDNDGRIQMVAARPLAARTALRGHRLHHSRRLARVHQRRAVGRGGAIAAMADARPGPRPLAVYVGDPSLIVAATRYLGTNPTGRRSLWCADFANMILRQRGYRGTDSREARSFLRLPHIGPRVGAIAVLGRRRGGHVGFVEGFDRRGNPIIVSGNHGHRVGVGAYPRGRVLAYVAPR